ncbi:MAG: signal recognition particle-docking protein FtsY [Pasteurella oralis]|uniref:signal recognition particle-docking protein FtsY n=1 Tax=Pasteurella oralis TaxID=1071947 RepID=UPI0026FFEE9D|nr:signal recognition particle-docking protein FtsY [Pasteurella oralis]
MSTENKKSGFWSWLGLGKKKEQVADQATQVSSQQTQVKPVETETSSCTELMQEEARAQESEAKSAVRFDEILPSEDGEISSEASISEHVIAEVVAQTSTDVPALDADVTLTDVESVDVVEPIIAEQPIQAETPPLITESDSETQFEQVSEPCVEEPKCEHPVEEQEKPSEGGFFSRLVKGLLKTKQNIGAGFRSLFLGKKIDDELFEELEEQLLVADLGVPTTTKIIQNLTQHASRKQLQDAELLYQQLKVEMAEILKPVTQPLIVDQSKTPYVILMVGVNGVGKTTTIGKLARKFQQQGKSVMLAAGDTFRAAAVEQLQIWGERNNIPVIAQSTGSDSASVIFDAMQSAAARNIDVLIADTAGRLQNKNNLMDELKKIVRVMKKYDETAPHEIMLILDAGTGQNAMSQAKLFHEAVGLTGISLTKLDGTAKGGVIFAIADQFNLPIRYIGVGEKIEDLREFNADEFIEALFVHED